MLLQDFLSVFYPDTDVEIYIDYTPVFVGTAEEAGLCGYAARTVLEAYIDIDGDKMIVHITGQRKRKITEKSENNN